MFLVKKQQIHKKMLLEGEKVYMSEGRVGLYEIEEMTSLRWLTVLFIFAMDSLFNLAHSNV